MKLLFTSLYYDPSYAEPHSYLDRVPIHRHLPGEMVRLGHQVEVVHLFPTDADFVEEGVHYRFVRPRMASRLISGAVHLLSGRGRQLYEPAWPAIQTLVASKADLVHFHGLTLNWNLFLTRRALDPSVPLVLHYHGGYPAMNPLARRVQRYNLGRAARLLFTTCSHAQPFIEAGLARAGNVVELMETSSSFAWRRREEARRETGMEGDPVFLWVGRLHPIKDPLTALQGFRRILVEWPRAHLYLHYLTDELLLAMKALVDGHPPMGAHVHFRGRAPFERMEAIYNSADFLLQASRREFSGCGVLEGMACGVIPVVTDIPSFRMMTDGGRCGVLFPTGNPDALARAVSEVPRPEITAFSARVRSHFQAALSFPALARRLETIYQEVLDSRW